MTWKRGIGSGKEDVGHGLLWATSMFSFKCFRKVFSSILVSFKKLILILNWPKESQHKV